MKRRIQLFSVTGHSENPPWYASDSDFKARYLGPCDPDHAHAASCAPYAFQFGAERLLNVVYDTQEALRSAPFVYEEQRKTATTLVSIPYESLPDLPWSVRPEDAAPGYVFSMGRAGSTLLARLFEAIDVPSLSEPDVFTQYAMAQPRPADLAGLDNIQQVFGYVVSGLLSAAGSPGTVLKFRSQTNAIADQLMTATPQAKGLMLVRDLEPWAVSFYRTFSFAPDTVADTLAFAHRAVHSCRALGRDLEIVRYEDLCDDPVAVLRLIQEKWGLSSAQVDEARVREIMSEDSQADSPWGQETKENEEVPEGFLDTFHQQWDLRRDHLQKQGVDFLF